ncbi:NAD(P)/FAD-dependent oxidoreductase [Mesorhizobium sp. SP-1A]|uniref:NAD(P)/FAD-dependent oxidoreductase n=1 Tax=Mesorhizobium sp. SP-1A TaxID=3077840 RepID=UPI0028F71A91|nr:NAD(P)/FAD-dependent oxidoreductase [Mesorhizobium sp. SP-1A]
MEQVECIVVGAGVVGLAVARELALRGLEVLVLEAADAIGTGTSSRNSEVIHAGLYYAPGSLKARLCVAGREKLYHYCAERGIEHSRCGKLIVATGDGQEAALAAIAANARASGAGELVPLAAKEAIALEPALRCTAALFSPRTGIVDSHGLMLALLGDAEEAGAVLSLNTRAVRGRIEPGRIVLETLDIGTGERFEIAARHVVNSAGLGAVELAGSITGLDPGHVPALRYAKGNYFSVAGRAPFSRLIYPVPEPGGLGIHLTLDLNGIARFGPDVEWTDALDYRVDPARAERFYAAIRAYWPGLAYGSLQPAYSGIRPKISAPGEPNRDFLIQGRTEHGIPGLVNLFGIESPGLTSCLAIAETVADLLAIARA